MDGQLAMLGAASADTAPVEPVATFQRYATQSAHHVCVRCFAACRDAERTGAPRPHTQAPAWRREYDGDVTLLCYLHKGDAHREDRAAGRLAKQAPARRGTRVMS